MSSVEAGQEPGLILVNLNRDPSRALEWGRVTIRRALQVSVASRRSGSLLSTSVRLEQPPAAHRLLSSPRAARGYAPASRATVCMMEESGSRGAFSVSAQGGH